MNVAVANSYAKTRIYMSYVGDVWKHSHGTIMERKDERK